MKQNTIYASHGLRTGVNEMNENMANASRLAWLSREQMMVFCVKDLHNPIA
jgi:hypothetical protein